MGGTSWPGILRYVANHRSNEMRELLAVTKALSDESRVRVLMFLAKGELCVCQIIEVLGLAPSTVSKHMSVLHQARLVEMRKEARWIYYRLADDDAPACVREVISWLARCLADDPKAAEDARHVKSVRKTSIDKLCARYRGPRASHRVKAVVKA